MPERNCWIDGSVCNLISDGWNSGVLSAGQCHVCVKTRSLENQEKIYDFFAEFRGLTSSYLSRESQKFISENRRHFHRSFSLLHDILVQKIKVFKENLGKCQNPEEVYQLMRKEEEWLDFLLEGDDSGYTVNSLIVKHQEYKNKSREFTEVRGYWEEFLEGFPFSQLDDLIDFFDC
jgi:hypothetical protein